MQTQNISYCSMQWPLRAAAVLALLALAGCSAQTADHAVTSHQQQAAQSSLVSTTMEAKDMDTPQFITTNSGLRYSDVTVGHGAEASSGQQVQVHYTGWLFENGQQGAKFDSSKDRGQPFVFGLGRGQVIKGWDEGVAGMRVGGKRVLVIPPELGYGARGAGGVIPPHATLKFEVELLGVR